MDVVAGGASIASEALLLPTGLDPSACRFGRADGFRVGDPEGWQLHAGVAVWIDRTLRSLSQTYVWDIGIRQAGLRRVSRRHLFACGSELIELDFDSSWIRTEMRA